MVLWGRAPGAPGEEVQGAPAFQQPKDPEPASGPGCRGPGGELEPPSQCLPLGQSLCTDTHAPN